MTTRQTYADRIFERPAVRTHAFARDLALVAGGSALLALSARIAVPAWPVPITAQTFVVVMLGAMLGAVRGTLAVAAYLAEGACGLPVFAGGAFGAVYMAGPTGGYLAGFLGAAALAGFLAEKGWDRNIGSTLLAMTLAHVIIFASGLAWLSGYVDGFDNALTFGLYPFLPGALLKITLAAALLPTAWKWTAPRNDAA